MIRNKDIKNRDRIILKYNSINLSLCTFELMYRAGQIEYG